ncbi:unannotated protein [freshwater metagenome]|uniref:Unannotated protein n=1 Tax=freshwater metagenome TaxID=449393 RepID=A0A6J6GLZ6_9ZZZZ
MAQIVKPTGAVVTASPCDIQTFCVAGSFAKIFVVVEILASVRPNSDLPV